MPQPNNRRIATEAYVQSMTSGGATAGGASRSEVFTEARTFYMEVAVPPGTTDIYYSLLPGEGTTKFGRVTLRNLSRHGAV